MVPPKLPPARFAQPSLPALISLDHTCYDLERRPDGAVLVRMHSRERENGRFPDAVFAFRLGDPQFSYWDQQLRAQEVADR